MTSPHLGALLDTKAGFTLGVGTDVQLRSSIPIGAKVEIGPKGFYTRSQD